MREKDRKPVFEDEVMDIEKICNFKVKKCFAILDALSSGFRSFSRVTVHRFDTSHMPRKNRNDVGCGHKVYNMIHKGMCYFALAPFRILPHTTGYAGGC
jgi:hypothetical protein